MKTRNSFVSNSSSSSFILNEFNTTCLDEGFIRLLSEYVFHIQLSAIDNVSIYNEILAIIDNEKSEYPHRSKFIDVDIDDDWIGIGNVTSETNIRKILMVAQKYKSVIHFCTGGTSSEILPQAMIQSYLMDSDVNYEVCGDGSFDLRKIKDIKEILDDGPYHGPSGAILRYYENKMSGDDGEKDYPCADDFLSIYRQDKTIFINGHPDNLCEYIPRAVMQYCFEMDLNSEEMVQELLKMVNVKEAKQLNEFFGF